MISWHERKSLTYARGYKVKEFLLTHLENANLQREGLSPRDSEKLHLHSNEAFWDTVNRSRSLSFSRVVLDGFRVVDWFPRAPGQFFSSKAFSDRQQAEDYVTEINGVRIYEPRGKEQMVRGGIGSVRFKPIQIAGIEYQFCTATSDNYCHSGIPIAIETSQMSNLDLESFSFLYKISGQVKFIPSEMESKFGESYRVPQIYIAVEKLEESSKFRSKKPIYITPMVFFDLTPENMHESHGYRRNNSVTYVTCPANSNQSIDEASDWLDWYVNQYSGKIVTNFDEQRPAFREAKFSLQKVMRGEVEKGSFEIYEIENAYMAHSEIRNLTARYVDMSKRNDINIGDGATIHGNLIVDSSIENSFTNIEKSSSSDELKILLKNLSEAVSKMVKEMPEEKAKETAENLEVLVKEATKPEPRKQWC